MATIRIVKRDKFPGFYVLFLLWQATNSPSFSSEIVERTKFATGLKITAREEIYMPLILCNLPRR